MELADVIVISDPDAEARMERARMYVTRGMVRKTIKTKCKLSDEEFADLNKWARKVTGRKR